ncbi:MAG: hypothetical protein R2875_15930 [Desulfobacterales bacterium]
MDFSEPEFRNELIDRVTGIYENRWFHYGDDWKMRLYFTDGALIPENFQRLPEPDCASDTTSIRKLLLKNPPR